MVLAEKPAVLLSVSGCVTTKHTARIKAFPVLEMEGAALRSRFTSQQDQSIADSALSEAVAKKLSWLSISSRPVRRIFAGLNASLKTNPYRTKCAARSTNRDDIKKGKKPCPTLLRPREARRPHNGSPPRSLN